MEPISYMLGLTMNIIGLGYFMSTKAEYTYDGLRQRAINKRALKEYTKAGLDCTESPPFFLSFFLSLRLCSCFFGSTCHRAVLLVICLSLFV